MTTMLPDAIEREREAMLERSVSVLRTQGYEYFQVHELPGYDEPQRLTVPVLNTQDRPDILASREGRPSVLALVEPSTDLGENLCGRRWQALKSWADTHAAQLQIFVHPEDEDLAGHIAEHWHLSPELIHPLPRGNH